METFEYLPQLMVAYDGNDEFANLIHVKNAQKNIDYYCPCCGEIVRPKALTSKKEPSHYCHFSEPCEKVSQLHFFCKNWLFEPESKFYIDRKLFEVKAIDIEKRWHTKFGDYIPDITVYTSSGEIIYFEMFFSNRKPEDNYFCKWSVLGNSVVEVNIKEYMLKTDKDVILSFSYLYHDGQCYSKPYLKRDLYANTIGRIKKELTKPKMLDYKARLEQLDCFWQKIIKNASRDDIIDCIYSMPYEDMISCYEIIKKKQCAAYLKKDILNIINQKVICNIRNSLDIPFDENVYFDIEHIQGRTYEIGIRLNIQTEHIVYNKFYLHCNYKGCCFESSVGYPKIVFKKNIFTIEEIKIPSGKITELKNIFDKTVQHKKMLIKYEKEISAFEHHGYKIRFNNNRYTVLKKLQDNKFTPVLKDYYIQDLDINLLSQEIQRELKGKADKEFLENYINSKKAQSLISDLQNYKNVDVIVDIGYKKLYYNTKKSGIYFNLYLYGDNIFSKILSANEKDFLETIELSKNKIDTFADTYSIITELVSKINDCRNRFWKAELLFNCDRGLRIKIDQTYIENTMWHITCEEIDLSKLDLSEKEGLYGILVNNMKLVMKNMEAYGYRVMEVCR